MRLLRNSHEYSNGKRYDPATFKKPSHVKPVKDVPHLDILTLEIMDNGYAIVPSKYTDALRKRAKNQGLRWSFNKLDERRVRITPVKE
jgi:hypothetical protein